MEFDEYFKLISLAMQGFTFHLEIGSFQSNSFVSLCDTLKAPSLLHRRVRLVRRYENEYDEDGRDKEGMLWTWGNLQILDLTDCQTDCS